MVYKKSYCSWLLPIFVSVVQQLASAQFVTIIQGGTIFHTEITIVDGTTLTAPRHTEPTARSTTEFTPEVVSSTGSAQTLTPSDRQVTTVGKPTSFSSSSQGVPPPVSSTSSSIARVTISDFSRKSQSTTPGNALGSTNTVTITASPSTVTEPPSFSRSQLGLILGVLFAFLVILTLVIVVLHLRRRRKRHRLATLRAAHTDGAAEASPPPERQDITSTVKHHEAGPSSDEREIEPVPSTSRSEAQSDSATDDPPPPYCS
ncbi:hypothetical protein PM082_020183 [Marasmius tenuissimus]|nr:hypothetical protein PM082_020183 [Marasmius tenuissimus]